MRVQYGRVATDGWTGVYADGRIRCDCAACEGFQLFTPNAWEKHLGHKNRNNWRKYIYLPSGTLLWEALKHGKVFILGWVG